MLKRQKKKLGQKNVKGTVPREFPTIVHEFNPYRLYIHMLKQLQYESGYDFTTILVSKL